MTTVVWRDGVLAADGRVTECESIIAADNRRKIIDVGPGFAVQIGVVAVSRHFMDWLSIPREDCEEGPTLPDEAIVVGAFRSHDGGITIAEFEHGGRINYDPSGFYAWGSGAAAALGALHAGASAEQAVMAASKVDAFTGGEIQAVNVVDEFGLRS